MHKSIKSIPTHDIKQGNLAKVILYYDRNFYILKQVKKK